MYHTGPPGGACAASLCIAQNLNWCNPELPSSILPRRIRALRRREAGRAAAAAQATVSARKKLLATLTHSACNRPETRRRRRGPPRCVRPPSAVPPGYPRCGGRSQGGRRVSGRGRKRLRFHAKLTPSRRERERERERERLELSLSRQVGKGANFYTFRVSFSPKLLHNQNFR